MKQVVSEKLKQLMADDPWTATIDLKQLDTSSFLDPALKPVTVVEDDGFEQNPEPEKLSRAQIERRAAKDREVVAEAVSDLAKSNRWTKAEERQVFEAFDPQRERVFHVGDWECTANVDRGGSWVVRAVNDQSDPPQIRNLKLPQVARDDVDGMMTTTFRLLQKVDYQRHPWRDLTPEQRIQISRIASGGSARDIEEAMMTWVSWAGIRHDISGDLRYQELCDEIVEFVFRAAKIDITDEEWDWMLDKCGDHPLTIQRLYALHEMLQDERKRPRLIPSRQVAPKPEPEPTSAKQTEKYLDGLSDTELGELRLRALRVAAKSRNGVPLGPQEVNELEME